LISKEILVFDRSSFGLFQNSEVIPIPYFFKGVFGESYAFSRWKVANTLTIKTKPKT